MRASASQEEKRSKSPWVEQDMSRRDKPAGSI